MKKLTIAEFQMRSTLISKLVELVELQQDQRVAAILSVIFSPHVKEGEKKPYLWTDNETLGVIEKELKKIDDGEDED